MPEYTLYINNKEYEEFLSYFEAEVALKRLRGQFKVAEIYLTYHIEGTDEKRKTEKRYQEFAKAERLSATDGTSQNQATSALSSEEQFQQQEYQPQPSKIGKWFSLFKPMRVKKQK